MSTETKGFKVELIGEEDRGNYGVKTLVVTHDGREILRENDDIEPEHIRFHRGLAWVPEAIEKAYRLGKEDACLELIADFQGRIKAGQRPVGVGTSSKPLAWCAESQA